jgi:RHS repeat-associated protein
MWEGDNLSFELDSSYQPIRKYFTELGMDDYFAHLNYAEVTNWGSVLDRFYPQGWYAYIKDQVGTIYKVWDYNAKTVADNRTYDSFGNLVSQTGTTKSPLGFQGKYFDQESGLNYFYHRYYYAPVGRFINEDSIQFEGGNNFYSFTFNDPINSIDPFGNQERYTPSGIITKWQIIYSSLFGKPHQVFDYIANNIELNECQLCISKCLTSKLIQLCRNQIEEKILLWIIDYYAPSKVKLVERIIKIITAIHIKLWIMECEDECKNVCCNKINHR